ncbi:MAG: NADH:ubiquinone oxidoreductase [Chloroflexi bacterium]|nr:NADH:ubiquinone oxidoreductase [Chloroflexota bacterium]MCL5075440.1 NADH:ubiquinone oxidoreductase [Chloroflexota bacterium]
MKPKIGIFDFSGCEGCQLTVLSLEDELLDLLGAVEIVNFREAMTERSDDYAIAFVEGTITREGEVERLKGIRERAKILVALGSCAAIGGINCLKNFHNLEEVRHIVYGDKADYFETFAARPLKAVVPVDYAIYGCPIPKQEFLEVAKALLLAKKPNIPNYAVCVECKLAENICVFDKGMTCLGPVTRAGCRAICPTYGNKCEGCRGLVDQPNINSHKEVLRERGLTVEEVLAQFRMFGGCLEGIK